SLVEEVLAKAKEMNGLSPEDVAVLMGNKDMELIEEMYGIARHIKDYIYSKRIVLFAPFYISDLCCNDCAYCGFRASNKEVVRKKLNLDEVGLETEALIKMGHKRLLMVYGEHYSTGAQYIADTVNKAYNTKIGNGEIRRINVNAAPMNVDDYKIVKEADIGTFQIFQETYHHETYNKVHPIKTIKGDYKWRLFGLHRAQEAGLDDVAIGALFGLYDWRFEVLGMIYHALDMEREFGVGPHTISVPRLEPAIDTPFVEHTPYPVSDADFKKLVAILRLAVPYTGLILTCREKPELKQEVIKVGVSQIDAGSNIGIGAYHESQKSQQIERQQFQLADSRSLDEVIRELAQDGYIPSFCTACYRKGRTGDHFMGLARKAFIKQFCAPNASCTFQEYLEDYASEATKLQGQRVINGIINNEIEGKQKNLTIKMITQIKNGERDVFI
ncbi:MAG: [FeFe] hydrogenase H-cluster radical SAM maturase HydG, partial [Calditrichia bacterium]|nr:[FeFe] hydrogenase H-cluster radical SAM maturase HydG [Calditrichia bacterium]